MRRTNIRGHALRSEGKPYTRRNLNAPWERNPYSYGRHIGVALCECGTASPELTSDAARQRWHASHKDEIRQQRREEQPRWLRPC